MFCFCEYVSCWCQMSNIQAWPTVTLDTGKWSQHVRVASAQCTGEHCVHWKQKESAGGKGHLALRPRYGIPPTDIDLVRERMMKRLHSAVDWDAAAEVMMLVCSESTKSCCVRPSSSHTWTLIFTPFCVAHANRNKIQWNYWRPRPTVSHILHMHVRLCHSLKRI